MAKLNSKIPAFTIMESMVSIIIVMTVFSLASIVILNVTSTGMSREKKDAYGLVNLMRNETLQQERYIDETLTVDELMLEKTILDYGKGKGLKVLLIEVFKGKEKLIESRELISIKTE